jgi:outer membrane protein OmpA-like peptidoglycan-associated protein
MRRWHSLVGPATFAALISASTACNGPGSGGGCHYESWRGTCALRGVQTEKIVERFPQSFVVVAATYEPVSQSGEFTPPPFAKRVMAPAVDEVDLQEFLKKQTSVPCSVANPVGDPCAPTMDAKVAQYVPPETPATPNGPVGCAKIERPGDAPSTPAPVKLSGPFQFGESSSVVTEDVKKLADAAAQEILRDPKIECVAIKGQSAPGEPFTLANERAQAVRHLLETRGIDRSRLIVFEATAPTYTGSPDEQLNIGEHRRVHLSVVVYTGK